MAIVFILDLTATMMTRKRLAPVSPTLLPSTIAASCARISWLRRIFGPLLDKIDLRFRA